MECRPKRQHTVNKQGSVTDSRPSRGSFRIRKARKQKSTQTEDLNFSSSSSASSESSTSSSENEHPPLKPSQVIADKSSHNYSWHLRRPPSLKRRKQISSDSNDDYYTHSPSPQQASSLTTITTTTTNSSTSTNTILALQLIPRGPLIGSDNFEKWNDRSFTWNRPLPPAVVLSSVSSSSAATSEFTVPNDTVNKKSADQPSDGHGSFLEGDVSDDDACFTSQETEKTSQQQQRKTNTIYSSSQNLNARKLSVTGSLRSLPNRPEQTQQEIFERLRQAEEVSDGLRLRFFQAELMNLF